jgi:hypothetical protein
MDQGKIGNCWFISAVSGLVENKSLLHQVIPKDQSFSREIYAGIFHFNFWLYGDWIDVVIDDRLPCTASDGKLLFSSNNQQKNEFWCSLLEKAYAKFYGSYERLIGGYIYEAYTDMTGGIQELIRDNFKSYDKEKQINFWSILVKAKQMNSLMGCSIKHGSIKEDNLTNGLITGRKYINIIIENIRQGVIRNPIKKIEF